MKKLTIAAIIAIVLFIVIASCASA